jgi:hypothetical protein
MMLAEQTLIVFGSTIFLILGSMHLYYTFFSKKFDPIDPVTMDAMKKTSMRLTNQTTVWRAWIGFHGSHSSGAIYFGIINLILAVFFFDAAGKSTILGLINTFTAVFYLFLARKYWFSIPFRGIMIATGCFFTAFILSLFK